MSPTLWRAIVAVTLTVVSAVAADAQTAPSGRQAPPGGSGADTSPPGRPAPKETAATIVTLVDAQRRAIGSIQGTGDRLSVHDPAGAMIGRLVIESDRVKLRDPGDADRLKVKHKEYGAEIEDGTGQRLYRIRRDGGQDWKLEDAGQQVVAKLKARPDGMEVRDAGGRTIAKVKRRDGGLAFETEAGARTYDVRGPGEPLAGAWLALDRFSFAERAALWAYFSRIHR